MADVPSEKESKFLEPADCTADSEPGHVTPEVLLDKNGFRLFPQPVKGDNLDPLNWSSLQKHVILAIVMALYVFFFCF